MAFGGYKFYGVHRGTPASGSELVDTHCARVVAFLKANEAAGSHWAIDPAHSGSMMVDENEYITIDGTDYHCIDSIRDDNANIIGKISYFAYSYDGLVGYYVILTAGKIYLSNRAASPSPSSGYVNFYFDQFPTIRGPINYPPKCLQAFCLHAMSLEPFGVFPVDGAFASDFIPGKSVKLSPIGAPNIPSSAWNGIDVSNGGSFILASDCYFGYAIKGCDVISFAGTNYANPAINILSLDAFARYYNQNDANGLLLYPAHSMSSSYNENGEPIIAYTGYDGQFLDESGDIICCNYQYYTGSNDEQYATIDYSGMSSYNTNKGSNKVQIIAASIGLLKYDISTMVSGSLGKGSTKVELLSVWIFAPSTGSSSTYHVGDTFAGGNFIICNYFYTNGSYRIQATGAGANTYSGLCLLCGWDSSNPSITNSASWNTFDPSCVIET